LPSKGGVEIYRKDIHRTYGWDPEEPVVGAEENFRKSFKLVKLGGEHTKRSAVGLRRCVYPNGEGTIRGSKSTKLKKKLTTHNIKKTGSRQLEGGGPGPQVTYNRTLSSQGSVGASTVGDLVTPETYWCKGVVKRVEGGTQ